MTRNAAVENVAVVVAAAVDEAVVVEVEAEIVLPNLAANAHRSTLLPMHRNRTGRNRTLARPMQSQRLKKSHEPKRRLRR